MAVVSIIAKSAIWSTLTQLNWWRAFRLCKSHPSTAVWGVRWHTPKTFQRVIFFAVGGASSRKSLQFIIITDNRTSDKTKNIIFKFKNYRENQYKVVQFKFDLELNYSAWSHAPPQEMIFPFFPQQSHPCHWIFPTHTLVRVMLKSISVSWVTLILVNLKEQTPI